MNLPCPAELVEDQTGGDVRRPGHENERPPAETPPYSGKVLIIGTAFLVTAAAWGLMAYYTFLMGRPTLADIDLGLMLLHAIASPFIYRRSPGGWPLGMAIVALGLLGAIPHHYPFILLPDLGTGVFLILGRSEFGSQ
ncbi:MAG: hypothetical protein IRY86_02560 [Thermorudis peleae]|nr:hypothetical protein [Thermorudis peleae]